MYGRLKKCAYCGTLLDPSYDTYSMKPPEYKIVCGECDKDQHVSQKTKEE